MSSPSAVPTIAPTTHELSDEAVAVMLPLVYGSMFGFPLTADEIARHCGRPMEPGRVAELASRELSHIVFQKDGYIGLRGREASVESRRLRLPHVDAAWETARRRARYIGNTPFVRGLMVTGSLAHESYAPEADIDYLVLVAPRRLFTVFAVLGTVQRLTSVQTLCPNYYLGADRMELPERDYFVAREVLAAAPVLGNDACERFQEANRWAFGRFPNARRRAMAGPDPAPRAVTRIAEWLLSGRLGDAVEALLTRLLVSRIDAHYASCGVPTDPVVVDEAVGGFRLRFHARLHREQVRARLLKELDRCGVDEATAGPLLDAARA